MAERLGQNADPSLCSSESVSGNTFQDCGMQARRHFLIDLASMFEPVAVRLKRLYSQLSARKGTDNQIAIAAAVSNTLCGGNAATHEARLEDPLRSSPSSDLRKASYLGP